RPPNAFMLFRSWYCKTQADRKKGDLNKMVPEQWKALSPEERAKWIALAEEKKKEHRTRYPDYKYCP
ncbi:high mobility group box domain-containing protein, partial [Mycena pura]